MTNTFSFEPETTFEVIDGGINGEFDGVGDSVFPDTFFTIILGSSGEAAEFAEFDISEFSLTPGETITSARFNVKITGLEVGGLGANFGDNPDRIGAFGYTGNGVADASDFEAGVLIDTEDTSEPSVGQQLSFDITNFVQNLINNGEYQAGIGLRALDKGGVAVSPTSKSMPTLIIETALITNNSPMVTNDIVTTSPSSAIAIPVENLLVNDTDSDGDSLTITNVNNAKNGTVTLNDNGTIDDPSDDTIIFAPNQNLDSNAYFEYTVSDRLGGTDVGLVTVIISNNIEGTKFDDILLGTDQKDNISALEGNDTLAGNQGNDILDGGKGNDEIYGGAGNDNLFGDEGNDILVGEEGNDFLDGGNGKNQLYGGIGNDGLLGGKNEDFLDGGAGADFLNGGAGADTLSGGAGADYFYLDGNSLTKDIITDFNLGESDRIITYNNLLFGDLSFSGNNILLGDTVLATLEGFDTSLLTSSDFLAI